ncbi:MAG: ABC transporter permease [Alphaproteobacteria bacterium]|nr:ABC transporter permease [Alphaproteobacteria bacterium]
MAVPSPRRRGPPPAIVFLRNRPNLIRAVAVAVFFVVWEITGRDVNPLLMTYPSAIFRAAIEFIQNGELLVALKQSLFVFAIGMAISIVAGVVIGVMVGQWWFFEYTMDPFINALYAIPRIALIPLLMMWVGLQDAGKITVLVSIAIFPVIINTYSGVRDVRGSLLDIGRAFGASERDIFFKITLPAALPFIMTGVRLSIGFGIIGMVVAEFFTAINGLGGLIVNYANVFKTAKVFVPIIVLAFMGVGLTQAVQWLERRLSKWRILERQRAAA